MAQSLLALSIPTGTLNSSTYDFSGLWCRYSFSSTLVCRRGKSDVRMYSEVGMSRRVAPLKRSASREALRTNPDSEQTRRSSTVGDGTYARNVMNRIAGQIRG